MKSNQILTVWTLSLGLLLAVGRLWVMSPAPSAAQAAGNGAPQGQMMMVTLTPSKDNTLYDPDGTLSNGQGPNFFAGRTGGNPPNPPGGRVLRSVMAFDIAGSGIPAGSTINSVSLRLNVSSAQVGSRNVELHRLTADWGEGASNAGIPTPPGGIWANAQTNDATWTHRFFNTTTWTTPGGDFVATASAVTAVNFIGPYTWSTAQMASDVQGWLDNPATNFGWLLKIDNETPLHTAKRFDSRQNGTAANRPALTITYTPPLTPQPNLILSKTVSSAAPNPGEQIIYTIVVLNNGTAPATNAVISDSRPAGLTFGTITLDPPGAGVIGTPPTLVTGLTLMSPSGRITVTVPATVSASVTRGSALVNTAAVTSAEVTNPVTDSATITIAALKVFLPLILK